MYVWRITAAFKKLTNRVDRVSGHKGILLGQAGMSVCGYIPVDFAVQKAKFRSRMSPTVIGRFIITSPNSASILCEPFSAMISLNDENTQLFGVLRIPHFVNHKEKTLTLIGSLINRKSEALWGMRNFTSKRRRANPDIDTAQTPKRFDGCLALLKKIRKTVTDSLQAVSLIVTSSVNRSIVKIRFKNR